MHFSLNHGLGFWIGLSEWGMNLSIPVRITFVTQSEMTYGSLELRQVDDHGKEERYKQNSSHLALRSLRWFGFREGLSGKRLTDNDQSYPEEHSPGVNTFQDRSLGKGPMCWQNARKCQEFWWVH